MNPTSEGRLVFSASELRLISSWQSSGGKVGIAIKRVSISNCFRPPDKIYSLTFNLQSC